MTSPLTRSKSWQRIFRTRAEDALPISIEHRRIYILPTLRGWAFLGSLLLMLVASVNYALSLGYALCFLLTGLFAATLLSTYRNIAGMELRRIDPATAFAGEPLCFRITLGNPSMLPRYGLRVTTRPMPDKPSTTVVSDIDENSDVSLELNVATTTRGLLPLGRLTLESDWPLGLWNAWSYVHVALEGIVFPTPEPASPELPADASSAAEGTRRRGQRGDVSGLRAYVAGDEPGIIAWKTLARGQGLHVRTFDTDSGLAQTRLTLGSTALPGIEAQLSRLAAWVLKAETTRTDYALELPAYSLTSAHGPAQQLSALSALARHGS